MATKRFPLRTKTYVAPKEGELRRIRRPHGFSFTTTTVQEGQSDKIPVSIATELQFTNERGTLLITMRRIARRPDSWYCSTSSIHLPPRAAKDLVQSLCSMTNVVKP